MYIYIYTNEYIYKERETIIINKTQESCIHLFLTNGLVNYWIFTQKFYIFKNLYFRTFIY